MREKGNENASSLMHENNNYNNFNAKNVKKIGVFPFIIAGMSFIPLIGVFFGLATIILGFINLRKKGWKLIALGLGGISITIILYGALFYFGFIQRGGIYDSLRAEMAETQLTQIVASIEYFKIQKGNYPKSLEELKEKSEDKFLLIHDPIDVRPSIRGPRMYYFESIDAGERYYIFSVGMDGIPYTEDDILPSISEDEIKRIGYRGRPIK